MLRPATPTAPTSGRLQPADPEEELFDDLGIGAYRAAFAHDNDQIQPNRQTLAFAPKRFSNQAF